MEKNTKIILAIGVAGLAYFLYKKGLFAKKTIAEVAQDVKKDVVDVVTPKDDIKVNPSPPNPGGLLDRVKAAVEPPTKPCEVTYHNCTRNPRKEIIQIPYDDEKCDTPMRYGGYQPEPPPCAQRGDDDLMIIELFKPMQF